MKIALLEPFMTGSHATWGHEYAAFSQHQVDIFQLPGRHWKWRMHGGAVSLAEQFLATGKSYDLLLATDMLDLTTFLALSRHRTAGLPTAVYFHENQLTYPWSPKDADAHRQRDAHYAFINYSSALAADRVLFNSDYHRSSFLEALPGFLAGFPDFQGTGNCAGLAAKSLTLPLGLDLRGLEQYRPDHSERDPVPLILWNHRWEYDKNPEEFFQALFTLQQNAVDFRLVVLGESYHCQPAIFAEARERLAERIVHWGYAPTFADYARWLWRADLLPVTAQHDFFGVSTVQAIYCGCRPLLPWRLAYPEHLPEQFHKDCFYTDSGHLRARLAELCQTRERLPEAPVQHHLEQYDWTSLAPRYDELFSELASAACLAV